MDRAEALAALVSTARFVGSAAAERYPLDAIAIDSPRFTTSSRLAGILYLNPAGDPMHPFRALAVASVAALLAGCAKPQSAPADDQAATEAESAIRSLQDSNTAALNRRDASAWAATFTEAAVVYAANTEAASGRPVIERLGAQLGGMGDVVFAPGELNITVAGDVAYVTFPWTVRITPPTGASIEDRGNTLSVVQRQADGHWRFHRVMWTSSLPLPQ